MADECEADDAYCLKNTGSDDREPFGRVAFEVWRHLGAFDKDRDDDDHHANECEARSTGEFVDITV